MRRFKNSVIFLIEHIVNYRIKATDFICKRLVTFKFVEILVHIISTDSRETCILSQFKITVVLI